MRKELKKGDMEYDLFNDYWKIVKEYNIPEDNDEYWDTLIDVSCEFANKYNTHFARNIIIEYIESRNRLLN